MPQEANCLPCFEVAPREQNRVLAKEKSRLTTLGIDKSQLFGRYDCREALALFLFLEGE